MGKRAAIPPQLRTSTFTIPSQLRIATISAMSERLARECASETWPDEKIMSAKKRSRNLYAVVLMKRRCHE